MANTKKAAPWHGQEGIFSFAPGSVVFSRHDPAFPAVVYAEDIPMREMGVAWLCERVCQMQDRLRDEGQPDTLVEIQITRAQLRRLQRDPLYPDSLDWPLAYTYTPKTKTKPALYFYGVLMRLEKSAASWAAQIQRERKKDAAAGGLILPGHPMWDDVPIPAPLFKRIPDTPTNNNT